MIEKQIPTNEIDELIKLFKNYRKLILTIVLLSLILSSFYAFFIHKPLYSAKALVQIGKKDKKLVEPLETFKIKFMSKHLTNETPYPRISDIYIYKRAAGILKITAEGYDKEILKEILENNIKNISNDHNVSIIKYMNDQNKTLKNLEKELTYAKERLLTIRKSIKENEDALKTLTTKDQILINMHMLELIRNDAQYNKIAKQITSLNSKIKVYTRKLSPDNTFDSYLIDKVIILNKPINTNKKFIISIGLISGILFAFLLAFFLNFLAQRRV